MDILNVIENLKPTLSLNDKKLADYVINNRLEICEMTVQQFASVSDTSPAAIIRFSKKLGYSGFKEFQMAIAKNLSKELNQEKEIYEQITTNDSTEKIISKVINAHINAVKNTESIIKSEIIDEAVDAINNADTIHLFGVGGSYVVALDFQYKLVRINMKTSLHSDYHLQLVSASYINKNDIAIAISNSGKTKETFNSLKLAKERGAKTISITHVGKNPIADISDININTIHIEQGFRIGAISSRISQLTLIDIIFMSLIKKNYDHIPKQIIETGSIISGLKLK
ncbi:putative HTH-type transcriptional regulator YbbH [bioreactor metagenome]|jgi:DNA-binding MurR/RpiR family transcriptional regulator|uniref:RpiR family transcriptional regulator n=2 Tax=root TaxID=1 RepID=A0A562JBW6_9FIRM|nr:MurR/RpiR family transcriptional regulator [Sedimentibacter saalensis]MEA5093821.1 MurR/RpiR family transcriptional regulator [Sedimentibacter saalensis]TWH80679.1 RpiR family transcriptional regulator [Sedimentibacter saalensis]